MRPYRVISVVLFEIETINLKLEGWDAFLPNAHAI